MSHMPHDNVCSGWRRARRPVSGSRLRACAAALLAGVVLAAGGFLGCGLDALIIQKATNEGHVVVPDAQDSVLVVQTDPAYFAAADACASGTAVTVWQPSGAKEETASVGSPTEDRPYFPVRFPGTAAYGGLIVTAEQGGQMALGLLPGVPRQDSVLAPEKWYVFGAAEAGQTISLDVPVMSPLGLRSTAITLTIADRAATLGLTVGGLPRSTLVQAVVDADALIEGSDFLSLVGHILDCGKQVCAAGAPFAFTPGAGAAPAELTLRAEFAAAAAAACPDLAGLTVAGFEATRRVLSEELTFQFNYAPDRIKVVWQVDFNQGLTRNCSPTNITKWLDTGALTDPNRTMFITGGVHVDTPICGEGRTEYCLTSEQRAAINLAMGNSATTGWQPNVTRMWDNGQNGDTVAGDNVWTFVLEVPYWDPADAPDGAGLRVNYKFTWGKAKSVWTGTEEWPGNSRLLEIVDITGDHLVVRRDLFGDETTNKDNQNLLTPSRGGCGVVRWQAVQASTPEFARCVMDSREAQIDTDGDCVLDTYPTAPTVLPAVIEEGGGDGGGDDTPAE
jgi:hypothetical protein